MFHRHAFFEHHSRLFEKGDLKYVILDLIKEKPSHGYEIIRSLERYFHGFYSPSAGSVYPTLQLLEDMDYIKASEQDGKKVYTITEEGNNFLKEREETVQRIKDHLRGVWGSGNQEEFHNAMRETIREYRELAHDLRLKAQKLDPARLNQIKETISRARRDIEAILDDRGS